VTTLSFWTERRGLRSWLLTLDHKRIGVLYFFTTTLMLFIGGVFALALRIDLLSPDSPLVSTPTYNKLFTHHGVIMVFLFMIPALPGAFGNFLLPIMIGARDVAFPRINLVSYWVYALGATITIVGLIGGGVDTGWTFYAPYSTTSPTAVTVVVIGIFVVGVSSILTGLNFIVTVHTLRAQGITWMRIPLFVWTIYATSIIQVLATPVLGLSLAAVAADRLWQLGLFDPSTGGDPVLFQHLFWFYSHPAVYIMVLPAMGVISEVTCAVAHNPPRPYTGIVAASIGIALVGFLTWGHHMFVAGMSTFDVGLFGLLSMFVAIFSAIKVFVWTLTFYGGRITIATPTLYVFTFIFLFVFGGMSGVAVATSSLDVHWHDTYFVVAHFHFIMVGGTVTAFLAALHFWFPKVTGRMYPESWGKIAAVAVSIGFVLTFLPQFLLGNAGMPRRYATYPPRYQWLHVLSTGGATILAAGMMLTVVYLVVAWWRGPRVDNLWRSRGFEWRSPSPPPEANFVDLPQFAQGAYDYEDEEAPQ
jgi:cytochrome c oxidase subunit 1